jgi:hypothetical protein
MNTEERGQAGRQAIENKGYRRRRRRKRRRKSRMPEPLKLKQDFFPL